MVFVGRKLILNNLWLDGYERRSHWFVGRNEHILLQMRWTYCVCAPHSRLLHDTSKEKRADWWSSLNRKSYIYLNFIWNTSKIKIKIHFLKYLRVFI